MNTEKITTAHKICKNQIKYKSENIFKKQMKIEMLPITHWTKLTLVLKLLKVKLKWKHYRNILRNYKNNTKTTQTLSMRNLNCFALIKKKKKKKRLPGEIHN